METSIPGISSSASSFKNKAMSVILPILALSFVGIIIYILITTKNISWNTVKTLIATESAKYPQPVPVEEILLQGAREIAFDPFMYSQAKMFSNNSGIAIERVLVDNAIAMAKNFNYLPVPIVPIIPITPTDSITSPILLPNNSQA